MRLLWSTPVLLAISMPVYAGDPALLGCWRSQHVEQHMPDKTIRHLNGDCVLEIDATSTRSECLNSSGKFDNLMTYQVTGPGRYVVSVAGAASAPNETAKPREIEYAVDDAWLRLTSVPLPRPGTTTPVPLKIVGLSIRSANEVGGCHARGPSRTRVSRGPISSILLSVPAGYEPLMKDPASDPELAQAINANFLIGQFVATGQAEGSPSQGLAAGGHYVLVVEDYKSGAKPMKRADFGPFKAMLKSEIGASKLSCEDEMKICFDTVETPAGNQAAQGAKYMSTQFVNVKGRVVIIYSVAFGEAARVARMSRRSADAFSAQMLRDNL
ncbi:MAG: hypothetical protein ABI605_15305 [Rhizobacter sp.]